MIIDEISCNYCESVLRENDDACRNCGAARTVATNTYAQRLHGNFESFVDSIAQNQRNYRLTKIHLAVSCLAFAALFGLVWFKFYYASVSDHQQQITIDVSNEVSRDVADKELVEKYRVSADQYKEHADQYDSLLAQWEFTSVLAALSSLRLEMQLFYQHSGEWPNSFQDMNIDVQEINFAKNIKSIQFSRDGQMLVELNETFEPGSGLSLQAAAVMMDNYIEWSCATNIVLFQPEISGCEYDATLEVAELQ